MSSQDCQAGSITGFPMTLSQKLNSQWVGVDEATQKKKLKALAIPTDFSVNWAPPIQTNISVIHNTKSFQIVGIDTIAAGTSLVYKSATYVCSEILSIVQNQHTNLYNLPGTDASYEVILAFQIKEKSEHPSSPDIILMCRPLIFSNFNSSPFWASVNEAVLRNNSQTTTLDMSTIYGYNASTLMPMITYHTCLSARLLNPSFTGSIKIRVHLVREPINVIADTNGLAKCSSVSKYLFATSPRNIETLFIGLNGASIGSGTVFQFKDGSGPDGYPNGAGAAKDNLVPMASASPITDFNTLINKINILVPQNQLGQVEGFTSIPGRKKPFKCYRIDPKKDIVNDQILVDPSTGQSLSDTMKQEAIEAAGGDLSLVSINGNLPGQPPSGLMPGDIQHIIFIIVTTLITILLVLYLGYIAQLVFILKDFHNGIYNAAIFVVSLVALAIFGVYFDKQK